MQQLNDELIQTVLDIRRDRYRYLLDLETSTKAVLQNLDADDMVSVETELLIRQNEIDNLREIDSKLQLVLDNVDEEAKAELFSADFNKDEKSLLNELKFMNYTIMKLVNQIIILDKNMNIRLTGDKSIYK